MSDGLVGTRRTRAGAVLTVAGALLLAVVVAVPAAVGGEGPIRTGGEVGTRGQGDTDCTARRTLTEGLPDDADEAQWVRFCPNRHGWVFSSSEPNQPEVVLTDQVDPLVDGWVDADPTGQTCPSYSQRYRLQVGFADGDVRELLVRPAGCRLAAFGGVRLGVSSRVVFGDTLRRMGEVLESEAEPSDDPPAAASCPERPRGLGDGRASRSGFLVPLPPTATTLCRYELGPRDRPRLVGSTALGDRRGESLRVSYHSRTGGIVDCAASPRRPLYSVVLDDVTGKRRTFTVDFTFCGTITTDFADYGLASSWLQEVLQRIWRRTP